MKEDAYVAGQIERALHGDPRTHELGIRVEADSDDVVLRGQVASEVLPPEQPEVLEASS